MPTNGDRPGLPLLGKLRILLVLNLSCSYNSLAAPGTHIQRGETHR